MPMGSVSPSGVIFRSKMELALVIKKFVYLKNSKSPMFQTIARIIETSGSRLLYLLLSQSRPVIYATQIEPSMMNTYTGSPQA